MYILKIIGNFVAAIIGIAIVVVLFYKYPNTIVSILDFNLALVKLACSFLPSPWAGWAEAALRGGLGADKAILFLEGTLVVQGVWILLRALFTSSKKESKK